LEKSDNEKGKMKLNFHLIYLINKHLLPFLFLLLNTPSFCQQLENVNREIAIHTAVSRAVLLSIYIPTAQGATTQRYATGFIYSDVNDRMFLVTAAHFFRGTFNNVLTVSYYNELNLRVIQILY